MKFKNLCPHAIKLNDGTVIEPIGFIARVKAEYTEFDENGICDVVFGEVTLPENMDTSNTYIVSALVAQAIKGKTKFNFVSPATGHKDAIRDQGQIVSVPGFIRA